jgi:hypothetical protein
MAELILLPIGIGFVGICAINAIGERHTHAKRRKEIFKQIIKNNEPFKKKQEKRQFINNFIDEIPELSYYEAAQLKKKLGNIYLEWNDE